MDHLCDYQYGAHVYHRLLKEAGIFEQLDDIDRDTAYVHFPGLNDTRRVSVKFLDRLPAHDEYLLGGAQ